MNENKKRIDIHRDYELFNLEDTAHTLLHLCLNHMQHRCPYDSTYKACFEYYQETLMPALEKFVELLADCVSNPDYLTF